MSQQARSTTQHVGVIGGGHLGLRHAQIYAGMRGVRLAGVYDILPKQAEAVASTTRSRAYTDAQSLLDDVDAVSVAVPTQDHHAVAKYCLNRGVHTLVEKPITRTIREANQLIRLSEERDLVLHVGHSERFNSAVEAVRRLATGPRFIEAHRLGPFTERSVDISVVLDLMIHDLDILLRLVDAPVKHVDAIGMAVMTELPDIANARLTFANGSVANVTASRLSPTAMRKIRIFQDHAYISLDYATQQADIYRRSGRKIVKRAVPVPNEQPLQRELAAFIKTVRGGRAAAVTAYEARDALSLALRIQRIIARTGQRR